MMKHHPTIGEAFGGGFFAGLIRIGSATYGLIVAPKLAGEISGEWGPRDTVEGAGSFFDGVANTQAMAYAGSDVAATAACSAGLISARLRFSARR